MFCGNLIMQEQMISNGIHSPFAMDILDGLSAESKHIVTKYHYDDTGSKLFQEIIKLPEYYPTGCELEILSEQSATILKSLNFNEKFNIVELGCGDGLKTLELLRTFQKEKADFLYIPIDISEEAALSLETKIQTALPLIQMVSKLGDYFSVLENLLLEKTPNLFLILGGNIGNYDKTEAIDFLNRVFKMMHQGDKVLIGFDLQKCPPVIQRAYDDSAGITKEFNMNLLDRINSELEANAVRENFDFYCCYNPDNGEVRCYLYSTQKQTIYCKKLKTNFNFEVGETISMELSKKYTKKEIENLARGVTFKVVENFIDSKNYFTDSLWQT